MPQKDLEARKAYRRRYDLDIIERLSSHSLMVQNIALSRRRLGFDSRWEYQIKHLEKKGYTYFGHMLNAFRYAWVTLKVAGIYLVGVGRYIVHAFFPECFGNTTLKWMNKKMTEVWTKFAIKYNKF
jgi:hypothetical protein